MNATRFPILLVAVVSIACGTSGGQAARGSAGLADTSAPAIPADLNLPEGDALAVGPPDDTVTLYYRDVFLVAFDDTVSGSTIRGFLTRYRAVVIGGASYVGPRGGYVIRVADPARSFAALDSLTTRLEREPGVAEATWLTYRSVIQIRGRFMPGWPLLTDRLPNLDVSRVVTLPEDTFRIYRTDISLSFKPKVSDSAKVEFFLRHAMRVIGVTRSGRFFVRIPDPGSAEQLFKVIAALRREPEIALAGWLARSALSQWPPAHPPP